MCFLKNIDVSDFFIIIFGFSEYELIKNISFQMKGKLKYFFVDQCNIKSGRPWLVPQSAPMISEQLGLLKRSNTSMIATPSQIARRKSNIKTLLNILSLQNPD